jgi:hypothetical protein
MDGGNGPPHSPIYGARARMLQRAGELEAIPGRSRREDFPESREEPYFLAQPPSSFWTHQPAPALRAHSSAKIFWILSISLDLMLRALATSA